MAAGELDERMNAFYDGKYDVLLSTTIVESGLDIPTANTLIVQRADMFGLAQLYQLRGRVGRAKLRAYAYLTTQPRKPLTPQAERRLKVLGSLDTLGAGFTLASHDLDIRGAGNLLGEEQSGHIREVGFELYQEMLEEAIARIRSGEIGADVDTDDGWSPQINLGVPVLIPDDYVPDLDVRLGLYRRLATLTTKTELEGFAAELHDRFGKLPSEVETLLRIVRVKAMCRQAGIERMDTGPKGATRPVPGEQVRATRQAWLDFFRRRTGWRRSRTTNWSCAGTGVKTESVSVAPLLLRGISPSSQRRPLQPNAAPVHSRPLRRGAHILANAAVEQGLLPASVFVQIFSIVARCRRPRNLSQSAECPEKRRRR